MFGLKPRFLNVSFSIYINLSDASVHAALIFFMLFVYVLSAQQLIQKHWYIIHILQEC